MRSIALRAYTQVNKNVTISIICIKTGQPCITQSLIVIMLPWQSIWSNYEPWQVPKDNSIPYDNTSSDSASMFGIEHLLPYPRCPPRTRQSLLSRPILLGWPAMPVSCCSYSNVITGHMRGQTGTPHQRQPPSLHGDAVLLLKAYSHNYVSFGPDPALSGD